ncbi:MAG: hypothetical protein JGK12_12205 [Microcoleus sp. PH2017_01_SCD_O_A]|uniref:hypothetical protein n=1 Tax=unclassified Microcoleus TaxID=2642155 RepID=UPI001D4E797F|nr:MULTISPECIES: hypothetical protein [unclassified Microcoleus]MCC3421498.1 hypothetical protein [Microcoleus sp. PH2017_07_MST_O_A]MCC3424667.1 hypothetical protein [Microcoleus sp. PH2017_01_SCD_O_A]MCC3454696.1 hypothetical protein [Microcoleus sp. PH2017_08_TRC_O_A]TAE66067.1 MAG: hypothetical protein EAZ86_22050 [Oscillatoriales cyanobacterium]
MQEPPKIKNPSITLYPFHLRDDGDEGYGEVAKNAQSLWENLADNVGTKFKSNELKSLREKLICYKDKQYYPQGEQEKPNNRELLIPDGKTLDLQPITQPDNQKLDGSIYALRIHDTYTADLTFYYRNATIKVADLNQLNPQGCLLPNAIKPSLGQTLLLYAAPAVYGTYRKLADESVTAFVHNQQQALPEFRASGILFGSPIFEYNSREDDASKRCHILVWLQDNPQTLQFATSTFNSYLMNLLCSRAKIVFVYREARKRYRNAQKIVGELEKKLPKFGEIEREADRQVKLRKLKELLAEIRTKMFDCTQQVRYLQEDRNTIDINAENYGETLTKIRNLSIVGDNLDFLQRFLDLAEDTYQRQIEIDLNYLIASQDLFHQSISTVRGMVEIEQVESDREQMELYRDEEDNEKKRDRQLENIIFFVGTAIGGGQIFSAAYPLIKKETPIQWFPDISLPLHPFAATILWSLVFGLVFGGLMLGIVAPLIRKIFR